MLIRTILFEDGVQTEIIYDPEKPLWDQEIKIVETPSACLVTACNVEMSEE
jgi:hypothetical protein